MIINIMKSKLNFSFLSTITVRIPKSNSGLLSKQDEQTKQNKTFASFFSFQKKHMTPLFFLVGQVMALTFVSPSFLYPLPLLYLQLWRNSSLLFPLFFS